MNSLIKLNEAIANVIAKGLVNANDDYATTLNKLVAIIESQSAQPAPSQNEPVAWESTTETYKKYITQKQYDMFNDNFKSWYKPYKCNSCTNLSKPQPTSQDMEAELIKAAENYAEVYEGDDRDMIKTDVINAFYQGWNYAKRTM